MNQPARVLRTIVDQIPMAICVFRQGRLVYSNAAARQLAGDVLLRQQKELGDFVTRQLASAEKPRLAAGTRAMTPAPGRIFIARSGERFQVSIIANRPEDFEAAVALSAPG